MLVSRFAIKSKDEDKYIGFETLFVDNLIDAWKWKEKPTYMFKLLKNVKIILVTIEYKEQPWEIKE